MTEIITPDHIIRALTELREQASAGANALYEAEKNYLKLSLEAEKIEAASFMRIRGLVADRQALSKLESAEARETADLAKAQFNRIKTHLQLLNQQQTAIQTQARMVEITYRQAGLG